jgi:hypothetical protein
VVSPRPSLGLVGRVAGVESVVRRHFVAGVDLAGGDAAVLDEFVQRRVDVVDNEAARDEVACAVDELVLDLRERLADGLRSGVVPEVDARDDLRARERLVDVLREERHHEVPLRVVLADGRRRARLVFIGRPGIPLVVRDRHACPF